MRQIAHYEISDLPVDQLGSAYPLIREIRRGVSLDGWIALASDWLADECRADQVHGIKKLELEGIIRGLFTYEVRRLQGGPPRLLVDHFVAIDILYEDQVADELMESLDQLAKANQCDSVDIDLGVIN